VCRYEHNEKVSFTSKAAALHYRGGESKIGAQLIVVVFGPVLSCARVYPRRTLYETTLVVTDDFICNPCLAAGRQLSYVARLATEPRRVT
jgi:hypothetical protein